MTPEESGPGLLRGLQTAAVSMFRRRWRTFAAVAIVTFVAAAALVLMLPWRYEAVARVKIDPSSSAALGQMSGGDRPDQNIFDTEVNVMRSRDIALAVARSLDLQSNPVFAKGLTALPRTATTAERDARANTVATRLSSGLAIERDRMTYIVNVGYTAADPTLAADVANAVANEYIAYSVGRRTGTASRETSYLDQRLAALNQQAVQADERLAQYRAQTGIVSGGDATVTDQQISPLASQLATAESEAAAAQAKLAVARSQVQAGGLDAVSAVLNSQVIADLRSQRAQVVQRQGEVISRYGPRHPETIKVNEQLGALDAQIKEEANRIIGGLQSEASAARARASSLRSDMGRLRGQQSSDTRASVIADTYQRQADAAHAAYNKLAEQAQSMNQVARSSLTQAQVIESAIAPTQPTSPNRRLLITLALMGALAAGLGTIVAAEVLHKGMLHTRDIEQLGVPVLSSIPRLAPNKMRGSDGQPRSSAATLIDQPMSAYGEALRSLRRSLSALDSHKVVAIVSSLPDEGKTSTSLGLARICAAAGEQVLLIDTDLRRAGLRQASELDVTVGLTDVLTGQRPVDGAIVDDAVPGLQLLPVAQNAFTPEDLFGRERMADLLDALKPRFDRIIIDTPPILGVADARAIAALAEAVVVVVKWDSTPANALRTALSWLRIDQANVVGAVFSMVDVTDDAYGALYGSKRYAKYYSAD